MKKMHQRQRFSEKILNFFAVVSCLLSIIYPVAHPKKIIMIFLLDDGRRFCYLSGSFLGELFLLN